MKKIIVFLIVITLSVNTTVAQCLGAGRSNSMAYLGAFSSGLGCMSTDNLYNGVVVNIRLGGTNACNLIKTLPSGDEVIYWPKGKAVNWDIFAQRKDKIFGGFTLYGYCRAEGYLLTGPNGSSPLNGTETFTPNQAGLYRLTCGVHMMEDGVTFKQICKLGICWTSPFSVITPCPDFTRRRFDPTLSVNICVVDIGGTPVITKGACGNNFLTRPDNTDTYSYYWQTTPYGTDQSRGDKVFEVKKPGVYFLRAFHHATGLWGDAVGIFIQRILPGVTVTPPPVPTVNGSTCGNVTLSLPTAPQGTTYYWQGPVCPDNDNDKLKTMNAVTPYTDVQPGKTYYVAAFDGTCWSNCVAVTPTVNAIPPPVVADQNYCICDFPSGGVTISPTLPAGANTFKWYEITFEGTPIPFPHINLLATSPTFTITNTENKTYYVSSYNNANECESRKVAFTVNFKNCTKCRESFAPIAGEKYVLSAWVKEDNNFDKITYSKASIKILYGAATPAFDEAWGTGEIIEGWQKIEKEFTIPAGTTGITIELNNGGVSEDVYFDDIRVFPFRSNMVSYVYNPYTLKLVAELDANNYATYYKYDDEGKLQMVKKETVNGVKTIKEGRSGNVIK
jgi:hypothetical protein